ncbi:MAG: ribbon-helix-helix protein, CopG family [Propionibacteriaceae bacterium]|nr:ribbon-helix-helix protein, CopG family [Propionibacteriaceae bacterium]
MTQLAIRLDEPAERALTRLTESTQRTRSEIVREAVIYLDRARLIRQMRQESQVVAHDEIDRAESQAALEEMTDRRAWGHLPISIERHAGS